MKIFYTLLTLLSLSAVSFGQTSQSILDNVSKKMKEHKSFYVEFTSTTKNSSSGTNTTDTGKGWVKGNKFYASYGDNTIISNGIKTWMIVKEEKSVYVSDTEDEEEDVMNPRKLMTIWESGFKNKLGKETTINGEKVHVIYLYPKDPGSVEYHTIILYISKTKYDLKKVIIKTKDASEMTYRLKEYKANPEISDSKFVFNIKKYPGYTVIED